MAACHPAFSGTWSRDYEPLSAYITEVLSARRQSNRLTRAIRFNSRVHSAVARRLVPDGNSLLRESGHAGRAPSEVERRLFDRFFLARRAEVCVHEFVEQVVGRTSLIVSDLAGRPVSGRHGRPDLDTFQAAMRRRLERLPAIMDEIL
jgi:hypothetical protein